MNIKNIGQFCFQSIKSLNSQVLIDSSFSIKICPSKKFISIFQTSSVKCISNYNTNNILWINYCKLVKRSSFPFYWSYGGFLAKCFSTPPEFTLTNISETSSSSALDLMLKIGSVWFFRLNTLFI